MKPEAGPFETMPPAPAIGGDSYDVAQWLRECREHLQRTAGLEAWATVDTLLTVFATANPEVK